MVQIVYRESRESHVDVRCRDDRQPGTRCGRPQPARVHVDFKPVFANAALAGLKHFCVEHDNAAAWGDSLAAAQVSYQNVAKLTS
jgi:hypothetical protein